MPTEKEVYESHANRYEQLVYREDYQQNIPKAIKDIRDFKDLDIIELGAGTGRFTRFLSKSARSLYACDLHHHMLTLAGKILQAENAPQRNLSVADMRQMPFPESSADMVIAGWSFCYLAVWGKKQWKQEVDKGLEEAMRLIKPGGVLVLLESFGTGTETPDPPPHLNDYFDYIKGKGLQSSWFRTDYEFESMQEALELSSFFFGEKMALKVKKEEWQILPECTAILWIEK